MRTAATVLIFMAGFLTCHAAADAQQPARDGARHGAWTVNVSDADGVQACFAAASPTASEPGDAAREAAFV